MYCRFRNCRNISPNFSPSRITGVRRSSRGKDNALRAFLRKSEVLFHVQRETPRIIRRVLMPWFCEEGYFRMYNEAERVFVQAALRFSSKHHPQFGYFKINMDAFNAEVFSEGADLGGFRHRSLFHPDFYAEMQEDYGLNMEGGYAMDVKDKIRKRLYQNPQFMPALREWATSIRKERVEEFEGFIYTPVFINE